MDALGGLGQWIELLHCPDHMRLMLTASTLSSKVESLERRANLVTEYELERRKLEILGRLSEQYAALGPQLKDKGLDLAELKQYLQV